MRTIQHDGKQWLRWDSFIGKFAPKFVSNSKYETEAVWFKIGPDGTGCFALKDGISQRLIKVDAARKWLGSRRDKSLLVKFNSAQGGRVAD